MRRTSQDLECMTQTGGYDVFIGEPMIRITVLGAIEPTGG